MAQESTNKLQDRFTAILRGGKYLSLATAPATGSPWICNLAYNIGPDGFLYYYSTPQALHSRHIEQSSIVAISVFTTNPVDGFQATAKCTMVSDNDLPEVVEHYFNTLFPTKKDRDFWYRPPECFGTEGKWRFYRLQLTKVFLIDNELFMKERIDGKIELDLSQLKHDHAAKHK